MDNEICQFIPRLSLPEVVNRMITYSILIYLSTAHGSSIQAYNYIVCIRIVSHSLRGCMIEILH